MKNIINPKISNMGSVYISISKKCSKSEDCEQIQNIKFFEETVKLQVPADESGEVCVNVYIDKWVCRINCVFITENSTHPF